MFSDDKRILEGYDNPAKRRVRTFQGATLPVHCHGSKKDSALCSALIISLMLTVLVNTVVYILYIQSTSKHQT
jgi:hypothetical protein